MCRLVCFQDDNGRLRNIPNHSLPSFTSLASHPRLSSFSFVDGFPNALPTTPPPPPPPPPSVLLTNSYIAPLPIRKMSKVSPLSNGSTRTFMSPVGRRPVHSGVQSRRYCLSWRGDIPGENRQFRPVTGARQERSTWQTDVQNRRSTGHTRTSISSLQVLTLSLLSLKSVFSQPFKKRLHEWCSENL